MISLNLFKLTLLSFIINSLGILCNLLLNVHSNSLSLDNLQLSGNIQVKLQTKDSFNYLYNNIAVGYYNSSIKWLYSR